MMAQMLEPVEKHRERLLGDHDHGVIVGRLNSVTSLKFEPAGSAFRRAFSRWKCHVFRRKRRAVMKFDALSELEGPLVALKLPGLSEHADVILFLIIELDQRLDDVLPIAIDRARAVIIRMRESATLEEKSSPGRARPRERRAPRAKPPSPPSPPPRQFSRNFV